MEYKFKIYFKYIVNNIKIRIYEETIENNESPIKLFQDEEKKFIIQPYFYLICGKQGKKVKMRKPQEKGLTSFIEALLLLKHCSGFGIMETSKILN